MKQYNDVEQGTAEWHFLRKGKVTGTVLKSIMGTSSKRQDAIYEIIAERLTLGVEAEVEQENPMARGTRLEPDAITMFEFEKNIVVDRTGFCEDDNVYGIAQSPDGLIGDEAAIEIKCPGGKNYVKIWLTNLVPDEYYWQVIQYFVVNEKLKKLYFVAYHPDIKIHPMHIIEVTRDSLGKHVNEAREAEKAFLLEVESILSTIITL
jgi:putative phage-type endonuclease